MAEPQQNEQRSKLHGVYNALDTHNYTRAIKLMSNKSIASLDITLALKSHAYERLGKKKESLEVLLKLLDFLDNDWSTTITTAKQGTSKANNSNDNDDNDSGLKEIRELLDTERDLIEILDNTNKTKNPKTSKNSKNVIIDETTLSTISITLRSYRLFKTLINMYSYVIFCLQTRKNNDNELFSILLQQLFFNQLRYSIFHSDKNNFHSMQTTALQLARVSVNSKLHFSWAASCAMLVYQHENTALPLPKKELSLRLAEGLAKKVVLNEKVTVSAEEWRLYLSILSTQKKFQDIHDVIQTNVLPHIEKNSNNSISLTRRETVEMLAHASFELQKYDSAQQLYLDLWKETKNFNLGLKMITSAFLQKDSDAISNAGKKCLEKLDQMINDTLPTTTDKRELRGLYLLLLEGKVTYIRNLPADSDETSYYKDLTDQILQYAEIFSSVIPCCFEDLKSALELIIEYSTSIENFIHIQQVLEWSNNKISHFPTNKADLRTFIAACYFNLALWSVKEKLKDYHLLDANQIIDVWDWSTEDSSVSTTSHDGVGQKDILPGDELVIIICNLMLHDQFQVNQKTYIGSLLRAASLLERAHKLSPYNHLIKIALIYTYGRLGAAQRCIEIFKSLDVKQIQLDSLSYLIIPIALKCGFYTEAIYQCTSILSMHRNTARDVPDFIEKAFQRGNFTQVYDMIQFQALKMKSSLQLFVTKGVILDFAPLCGKELGEHGIVGSISSGNSPGSASGNLDVVIAEKIIRELNDQFGAPSLLNSSTCLDETFYSDNRQFLENEISLQCSKNRFTMSNYAKKSKLFSETIARRHLHSVLVRIALIPSVIIKPNKKGKFLPSNLLKLRCESLRKSLSVANQYFLQDDHLWSTFSILCQLIIDVSLSSSLSSLSNQSSSVISSLKQVSEKIKAFHHSVPEHVESSVSSSYVLPNTLKCISINLPTRIVPVIAALETVGFLFSLYGWAKKKAKTKKEPLELAKAANELKILLEDFSKVLCNSSLTTVEAMLSYLNGFDNIGEESSLSSLSRENLNLVAENVITSQRMSKDRIIPFLEQMISKLENYTSEM